LHLGFEDEILGPGLLGYANDFQFHAAGFESQPEVHVRIGPGNHSVGPHLRRGIGAVERLQGCRVSRDNRALPLVQRSKTGWRVCSRALGKAVRAQRDGRRN
jgi:hypothetical protein